MKRQKDQTSDDQHAVSGKALNKFGFIETPYRKVDPTTGRVTSQIDSLTADIEDNYVVAQANAILADDGSFVSEGVVGRFRGDNTSFSKMRPN